MPVVFQQTCALETGGELLHDFLNLVIFEPWVDDLELLMEHRQHYDFGEARAVGIGRALRCVEVDNLPAESRELIEHRLLDVVPFVELDVDCGFAATHVLANAARGGTAAVRRLPVSRSCNRPAFNATSFTRLLEY